MNEIHVNLKNCYGINKLSFPFKFNDEDKYGNSQRGCLIYASNGTMKTSFANTFLDVSNGEIPKDRVHHKPTVCNIVKKEKENSEVVDIDPSDIFVIESYNEETYRNAINLIIFQFY